MENTMNDVVPAQLTPEQREQLLATMAKIGADVQAIIQSLVTAFAPIADAVGKQLAEFQQALQTAGLLDQDGRPVQSDRPAWQTPYGPSRHR
jgi:hypothetical protein